MKSFRDYLVEADEIDPTRVQIDPAQVQIDPTPAQPAQATSASSMTWPIPDAELKKFQRDHNLVPDGLIGKRTLAALKAAGVPVPQGFVPVPDKKRAPTPQADVAQQTGVTARASVNPATSQTTYTNAPQGQALPQANVAGGAPGVNPDVLNKAAELTKKGDLQRAKIYTDLANRQAQAAGQPSTDWKGRATRAAAMYEDTELSRLVTLANLNKN